MNVVVNKQNGARRRWRRWIYNSQAGETDRCNIKFWYEFGADIYIERAYLRVAVNILCKYRYWTSVAILNTAVWQHNIFNFVRRRIWRTWVIKHLSTGYVRWLAYVYLPLGTESHPQNSPFPSGLRPREIDCFGGDSQSLGVR